MSESNTNLKVAVRIRPLSSKELQIQSKNQISSKISIIENTENQIYLFDPKSEICQKTFDVDWVFEENQNTAKIFDEVLVEKIEELLQGINITVFAYGMTGAGKSHTVFGNESKPGLIELAGSHLFNLRSQTNLELTISMLEIYNEKVKDLLSPIQRENLLIVDDPNQGVVVNQLSEIEVKDENEISNLIKLGNARRTTAETGANLVSSRSHAVCIFKIKIKNSKDSFFRPKFQILDLAGSERAITSNNYGMRHQEGGNINRSLLALGKCISVLSSENSKGAFIPYRDSKLTRLLKDSLGGNVKALMIACVSPSPLCYEETLNTLKYATMAKKIVKYVERVEEEVDPNRYEAIICTLKAELESLKKNSQSNFVEYNFEAQDILNDNLRIPGSIEDEENTNLLSDIKYELYKKTQYLKLLIRRYNENDQELRCDIKEFYKEIFPQKENLIFTSNKKLPKNEDKQFFTVDDLLSNREISKENQNQIENFEDLSAKIRELKIRNSKFQPNKVETFDKSSNSILRPKNATIAQKPKVKPSTNFGFEVTERFKRGDENIIRIEMTKRARKHANEVKMPEEKRNSPPLKNRNAREDYSVIYANKKTQDIIRKENKSVNKHHLSAANILANKKKKSKQNDLNNQTLYNPTNNVTSKNRSITIQGNNRNISPPLKDEECLKVKDLVAYDSETLESHRVNKNSQNGKRSIRATSNLNRNRDFRKFLKEVLCDILENKGSDITIEKVNELQKFRGEGKDLILGEDQKQMLARVDDFMKENPQKQNYSQIHLTNDPYRTPEKGLSFFMKFKERNQVSIPDEDLEKQCNDLIKLSRNAYM